MPKRILRGCVVGTKCTKTAHVLVQRKRRHPKYGKAVSLSAKYAAHDPDERCVEGEVVTIMESRPLSKTKKWVVVYDEEKVCGG